jgi:hypothetical protein
MAAVRERGEGIHEGFDEIAVVLPEPQQDDVGNVFLVVLIDEFVAGDLRDLIAKLLVDVVVVTELLDHLSGLEPKSNGRVGPFFRVVRGRAHEITSLVRPHKADRASTQVTYLRKHHTRVPPEATPVRGGSRNVSVPSLTDPTAASPLGLLEAEPAEPGTPVRRWAAEGRPCPGRAGHPAPTGVKGTHILEGNYASAPSVRQSA